MANPPVGLPPDQDDLPAATPREAREAGGPQGVPWLPVLLGVLCAVAVVATLFAVTLLLTQLRA